MVAFLELPQDPVMRLIINGLDSNEDVFSLALTCTAMRNCVSIERRGLYVFPRNKNIYDLVPCVEKVFGRLELLSLHSCYSMTDLSIFCGLKQLQTLKLYGCNSLVDLS